MHVTPCLLLGLLVASTGVALAHDRELDGEPAGSLVTEIGEQLTLDLPSGDVHIVPSKDGKLHVDVTFFCEEDSERCRENAAQARISHDLREGVSTLGFEPEKAYSTKFAQVEFHLQIPSLSQMDINMKGGALDVDSPTGCLAVHVGAGDIQVRAPLQSVATVSLDSNLGDASLIAAAGAAEDRRPLLVGSEVRWEDGPGSCDLRVKLQIGRIQVELE